jgi:hypothetical protein
MYDVGGQALQSRYLINLLHGSDVILFVYDITNVGSFAKLEEWIKILYDLYKIEDGKGRLSAQERLPFLGLVGHKCMNFLIFFSLKKSKNCCNIRIDDLIELRSVKLDKHQQAVKDYKLNSFFTSINQPDSIQTMLKSILSDISEIENKATREATTRLPLKPTIAAEQDTNSTAPQEKACVLM